MEFSDERIMKLPKCNGTCIMYDGVALITIGIEEVTLLFPR